MDAATDPTSIEAHLRAALSNAENDEVKYHLRESMQKLQVDD
jgi:hypothetical protein